MFHAFCGSYLLSGDHLKIAVSSCNGNYSAWRVTIWITWSLSFYLLSKNWSYFFLSRFSSRACEKDIKSVSRIRDTDLHIGTRISCSESNEFGSSRKIFRETVSCITLPRLYICIQSTYIKKKLPGRRTGRSHPVRCLLTGDTLGELGCAIERDR